MRVFISYCHKDTIFVIALARALRKHSIEVRLDEHHFEIGEYLTQRIIREIYDADFVIVVLSHNSIASQWVNYELSLTLQRESRDSKARLLPILLQDITVPNILSGRLIADFRTSEKLDKNFLRLLKVLGVNEEEQVDEYVKVVVTAPINGWFYLRPHPNKQACVEIGQKVSRGNILCFIESHFMMNELNSEVQGTIVDVFVNDGERVDFGQPLFLINTETGKDLESYSYTRLLTDTELLTGLKWESPTPTLQPLVSNQCNFPHDCQMYGTEAGPRCDYCDLY